MADARTRLVIAPSAGHGGAPAGRVGPRHYGAVVPLWTRPHERAKTNVSALRHAFGWPADRLVLLYSGNMGLGHRFTEFLAAARTLGPARSALALRGLGAASRRGDGGRFGRRARRCASPYAEPEEHLRRARARTCT